MHRWLVVLLCFFVVGRAQAADCAKVNTQALPRVNISRIRDAWLEWNNELRASLNLRPYALDDTLNITAGNWSLYAQKRGFIDHRRSSADLYYDYSAIEQWFRNFGVTFTNVHSKTFTENIGWGVYQCKRTDCTRQLIKAMRSTFDFYLSEKGKKSGAHYNSLTNPDFTVIGLGVALDASKKRYYITVHYGTKVALEHSLCEKSN